MSADDESGSVRDGNTLCGKKWMVICVEADRGGKALLL